MIGKVAWYDFSFLKFTKALRVAQHVVNPRECSLYSWEKCVFCCFWTECSIDINDTLINTFGLMTHVSFKACVSWLISFLDDLSIDESGVSKSPVITVLLSLFPFMVVSIFALHIEVLLCWMHIDLKLLYLLRLIPWLLCSVLFL